MCGCGLKSIENTLAFLIKNTDWSFQRIMCKCVFWSWLKFCLLLLISLSLRQCFYTTFLCYRFCCPSRLHHCKDIDHVFDTTIRRISLCWVNINTVFLIFFFFWWLIVLIWKENMFVVSWSGTKLYCELNLRKRATTTFTLFVKDYKKKQHCLSKTLSENIWSTK